MKKFDIKAWQEKQGIKGNFFNTAAPSKNKKANNSGLKGYYAEVCFRNNSTEEAELFGISADMWESSK